MKNSERIPEILSLLAKVWDVVPSFRLGQLLVNLSREHDPNLDIWALEDEDLKAVLQRLVDDHNL